ncbi:MAG: plasmid pRiA4b ORF-3 family protein [Spirochaetaceae bacterium]|jgi:hypothetical protein|nr:plasmid pRiA4b ORF-3 family protein [Spirochaetaceae bacterium]
MTSEQEDAVYEFLDTRSEPFTLKEIIRFVKSKDNYRVNQLPLQIPKLIDTRRLAFTVEDAKWITRRGVFTGARFTIRPTRLELLNGILIPGHRCIPFANPAVQFKDYKFRWQGKTIEMGASEGEPEEFYPYFALLGEEYAPQYVYREAPENEELYNANMFEDPSEVSLNTLDMRQVYRESGFSPGDLFVVTLADWLSCTFDIERVPKDTWPQSALDAWMKLAEESFFKSFEQFGPCGCTEEQIAFAFYLGGGRMRDVPAYSPEDFLLEKTYKIELAPFGMESRFWYAGKEIPDYPRLQGIMTQTDQTPVERILHDMNIPISEFVIQSYLRDYIYRKADDLAKLVESIFPRILNVKSFDFEYLANYIIECLDDFSTHYPSPSERKIGLSRQRACELHSATIELAHSLEKGSVDKTWLPSHVFILLSQIQVHTACLLEDFNMDEEVEDEDIEAIDNSLDNMIDTYTEIKEAIHTAIDNYRHSNLQLVKNTSGSTDAPKRIMQFSIGGTGVWRRAAVQSDTPLHELRNIIFAVFGWQGKLPSRFTASHAQDSALFDDDESINIDETIESLRRENINELTLEYNEHWNIKIFNLSGHETPEAENGGDFAVCIAGEGVAPAESIDGPLRFRRYLSAVSTGKETEQKEAQKALGKNYLETDFNIDECNKNLRSLYAGKINQ